MAKKSSNTVGRTLYDYWGKRRDILSHDGKSPSVVLYFPTTLKEMYEKGFLTGEALKDCEENFGARKSAADDIKSTPWSMSPFITKDGNELF